MMRATPTGAVLSHDIWINHGATEEKVRRVIAIEVGWRDVEFYAQGTFGLSKNADSVHFGR